MKQEAQPIPTPMSAERLRLMQQRAAKQQPLAVPADQPTVLASVRERGKKAAKNGQAVMARAVSRKRQYQSSRQANYDDDGDEIEVETDWTLIDRYIQTELGTAAALAALANWRRAWEK